METKKGDRRVRRTKKLLLQGLTQLMSQKKINKITVKELTELVDVNRATFYLYYNDIFDMIEQVENEMFENFSKAFTKYSHEDFNYDNSVAFFTYVFEFVKEYADMCKVLLGHDGDYAFIEKFKKVIETENPPLNKCESKVMSRYFMPFILTGCIGAIQQWLEDDMKTEPKEMAVFILNMISNCAKIL